jgi:ATP-dependent Clp protease ATP-binding subunit ClpX
MLLFGGFMEKDTKYCGVLFTKVQISGLVYALVPNALLDGIYYKGKDEEYFSAEACDYEIINATDFIYDNTVSAGIGFPTLEKNIQAKFPDLTLTEAKEAYFNEICCQSYFAIYSENNDKVKIITLDLEGIMDTICSNNKESNNISISIDDENKSKEEIKDTGKIKTPLFAADIETIKKLEQLDSLEKIKEQLQDMINFYETCRRRELFESNAEEKISGEMIVKAFNSAYDLIIESEDVDNIKEVIAKLNDLYLSIAKKMDDKIEETSEVNLADDHIFQIYDELTKLLKLNDLNNIKDQVKCLKDDQANNVLKIAKVYDKVYGLTKADAKTVPTKVAKETIKDINATAMKKYFDKMIIGQEEAKEDVISAIIMNKVTDDSKNRSHCLLVGPTGSGKTLIAEAVGSYLNIPVEIVDTTQITRQGYVGGTIEEHLANLINKADGDIEKAEQGIICFDEIDKMGTVEKSDVNGTGVLNNLLAFINGTTYNVTYNGYSVDFDTSKLTVFATGAFTDVNSKKLKNNKHNSYNSTSIGFGATINHSKNQEDIKYEKLQIEDFVKYGNMPIELMGRFTTISQLKGQTADSLKQIILFSNISALGSVKKKLKKLGVDLQWSEDYLDEVIKKALTLKTGARSLKSTIDLSVKKVLWEVLTHPHKYSTVILTDKTVIDNLDCDLITSKGNALNLRDITLPNENKENILKLKR